jgi:hypothetical protein
MVPPQVMQQLQQEQKQQQAVGQAGSSSTGPGECVKETVHGCAVMARVAAGDPRILLTLPAYPFLPHCMSGLSPT